MRKDIKKSSARKGAAFFIDNLINYLALPVITI